MKSSGNNGSSSKVDRKTVEKNRRNHMKTLCFKLGSLIPKEEKINTKDAISQHDHLEQATTYIRKLKARIERLKQRKKHVANGESSGSGEPDCEVADESGPPVLNVRCHGSFLEVVLITGQQQKKRKKFMLCQVIGVLMEEGVEVVNASFSAVTDKIFCTIHSQANLSSSSRNELDVSRISERLKKSIQ